jgi:acetyltransferase-like isoleucine patch superfamily enzyme
MREAVKTFVRALALIAVLPLLASFWVRSLVLGRDRAIEGSSQTLSLLPGLVGQYLRRAFLGRTLAVCHPTSLVSFGTIFSQAGAMIDENVYIGPGCNLGLVHIERDALLAASIHVPSGRRTHGTSDPNVPIREQPGERTLVTIGAGAWIGSASVIMADIGKGAVIGAGSVVTKPVPDGVIAAGSPARVIRRRDEPADSPVGLPARA